MIELDVWIRFWGRIEIRWMSGNLKLAYENYVSRQISMLGVLRNWVDLGPLIGEGELATLKLERAVLGKTEG